jgi:hypothetical protein
MSSDFEKAFEIAKEVLATHQAHHPSLGFLRSLVTEHDDGFVFPFTTIDAITGSPTHELAGGGPIFVSKSDGSHMTLSPSCAFANEHGVGTALPSVVVQIHPSGETKVLAAILRSVLHYAPATCLRMARGITTAEPLELKTDHLADGKKLHCDFVDAGADARLVVTPLVVPHPPIGYPLRGRMADAEIEAENTELPIPDGGNPYDSCP